MPLGGLLLDEFPGEALPEDELPGDVLPAPDELLLVPDEAPLDGDVLEPEVDGLVAVLDEDGERGVAVEPLLGEEVEPLLLEPLPLFGPELSQAPSDTAERSAAAISNLLSIQIVSIGLSCSEIPEFVLW